MTPLQIAPLGMAAEVDLSGEPIRLSRSVWALLAGGAGAALGWFASETGAWSWDASVNGRYALAFMLLVLAWRVVPCSFSRGLLVAGWVSAATAMIPSAWTRFFGQEASPLAGVAVWLSVAICVGSAAAAGDFVSRRWMGRWGASMGFAGAVLLTSIPPVGLIGMALPWVAAGAMFPRTGVAGYALLILIGALAAGLPGRPTAAARAERLWQKHGRPLVLVMLASTGLMIAVQVMSSFRAAVEGQPIATITVEMNGPPPLPGGSKWFDLQDRFKREAVAAIEQGSRTVVLPEGSVSFWDHGASMYWADLAQLARVRHAQVLVGAYLPSGGSEHGLQAMDNTLLELPSGKVYPARANLPVGMFRPWARSGLTFPLGVEPWSKKGIAMLEFGEVLYTICYEEVLLWPLAMASVQSGSPKAIVSAASNWFLPVGKWHSQERMIQLQARLYGLPLARSVVYGNAEKRRGGTNG